jgi:hypothetical protein
MGDELVGPGAERFQIEWRNAVDLGDSDRDWEVVGESVLIDRICHSAEWDWLRIDTGIDHGDLFENCTVAGLSLIGASPVAMFLLIKNWSSILGWLSKEKLPVERTSDRPHQIAAA